MTGAELAGIVLTLLSVWFALYVYEVNEANKRKGIKRKTRKQKRDEAWMKEINTGFDEWFRELRQRR